MQITKLLFTTFFLLYCCVFAQKLWSNQQLESLNNMQPSSNILRAMVPESQQKVMNGLEEFAEQYKTSPNAVEQFLLRQKRQQFLAKQVKDRVFLEWIGRINKLRTTQNGKAYLVIELARIPQEEEKAGQTVPEFRVTMGTWNNAYTDLDYKTLILPGTAMHSWLANFQHGEWVVFSGKSFAGDEDFLKEASPTQTESMLSPNFILKFEYLDKIDFPESEIVVTESYQSSEQSSSGDVSISEDQGSAKSRSSKISRQKIINKYFVPELTIRYYQEYRLSNYDWDYQSYINRWHQLVRYHWRNHPPNDYLEGSIPEGGEVFVLATVGKDGRVSGYQINSLGNVTDNMRESALEATRVVALPPLPEDFHDEELIVEYRFDHSPIQYLIKPEEDKSKVNLLFQDNNTQDGNNIISKMANKLKKKQLLLEAREYFHEELRREFSSHFNPHQRFDPNLELKVEISINSSGKVVETKLIEPGNSVKFQLAVLNGLSKARFATLPKPLRSEVPYRVRLKIIP
jgi:hypothetical protein